MCLSSSHWRAIGISAWKRRQGEPRCPCVTSSVSAQTSRLPTGTWAASSQGRPGCCRIRPSWGKTILPSQPRGCFPSPCSGRCLEHLVLAQGANTTTPPPPPPRLSPSHRSPIWQYYGPAGSAAKIKRGLKSLAKKLKRHHLREGVLALGERCTAILAAAVRPVLPAIGLERQMELERLRVSPALSTIKFLCIKCKCTRLWGGGCEPPLPGKGCSVWNFAPCRR